MTAQVEVRVHHGAAPGLGADVTGQTLRFKQEDDDIQNAQFPVPIPTAGFNYSWRKSFRLVVVTAPDNGVANLRFFSDGGSIGVGRRVLFDRQVSYTQATAADESSPISAIDVTVKTPASPEVLKPGELVNSGSGFPNAGAQDYVELQLEVGTAAQAGNGAGSMTLRYRWDET